MIKDFEIPLSKLLHMQQQIA